LLSRSCFGAAGIALIAAVVPSGASAQAPPPRPRIFSTATSAVGVDYVPDQQGGLTPIKDTFHMQFVTGVSSMSSSNGPAAKATVADPGNGATQGPANGCPAVPGAEEGIAQGFIDNGAGFIGTPLLDAIKASNKELQPIYDACTSAKWPFIAQADGFSPDKSTEGSLGFGDPAGQLNGQGAAAHAHLGEDGTSSTDSTMSGLKIAPLPGGSAGGLPLAADVAAAIVAANGGQPVGTALFTVGSIQSTTANLFDGQATVSHAESRLNGVKLIGGLMTIDSITSIADVHFTLDGKAVGTSSTTVQGAKVLGQPVTIDDKGVHPDGKSDVGTQALKDSGLSVRLVGATNGADNKGFMTAQSQGVVIDYTRPVENAPTLPPPPDNPLTKTSPSVNGTYFVRYNLASVGSRALARNLTLGGGSSSGTSGINQTISAVPPAGNAATSGFTGGTASAPSASLTPAGDGGVAKTSFLGLNFDLRWLYLAFTLAAFGMCVAPKLVLPARLPGLKA
jgi:hypothetical protein